MPRPAFPPPLVSRLQPLQVRTAATRGRCSRRHALPPPQQQQPATPSAQPEAPRFPPPWGDGGGGDGPKPPSKSRPPYRLRSPRRLRRRLFSNLNKDLRHEPGTTAGAAVLVSLTTVGAGILALPAVTQVSRRPATPKPHAVCDVIPPEATDQSSIGASAQRDWCSDWWPQAVCRFGHSTDIPTPRHAQHPRHAMPSPHRRTPRAGGRVWRRGGRAHRRGCLLHRYR